MIRTILTSETNSLTLELRDDLVGKRIEVLAFEIEQTEKSESILNTHDHARANEINNALAKYRVNLSGFKFDRDEANDYE
ncbi:hypothetical protein [Mucilaginibacter myungsuensis]|uniref:Uncharacterized protein n=1 Tax=Mucilaginibacter myungsuensis TaxID=649104 RepID=A0A929KUQ9_9SPHI|nr:hypothetical protein [Mucilaginibacter myungsuensis]MBE9661931.1 hypothetical protein [Mucilaginibacter myungsuensis]